MILSTKSILSPNRIDTKNSKNTRTDSVDVQTFKNTLVTGFSDLLDQPEGGQLHRGGPDWLDFPNAGAARFCRSGTPSDSQPKWPLGRISGPVSGDWIWLGPQVPHFGHAIADFSSRYFVSGKLGGKTRFILGDRENSASVTHSLTRQLLEWFDIPANRVEVVTSPKRFHRLLVVPQSEQLYGPPASREHLNDLTMHQSTKYVDSPGRFSRKVYVSRSRMDVHLAGELYIEDMFRRAGFQVVHPQYISVFEQLQIYMHAEHLVFASGSAIHGIELLGTLNCEVSVIRRRPGTQVGKFSLRTRARKYKYFEGAENLVFGANTLGLPAPTKGIGVPNATLLYETLSEILKQSPKEFDARHLNAQVHMDVKHWLASESALPVFNSPEYQDFLVDSLRSAPEFMKYLPIGN
jgi:hypothetical protein